MKVFLLDAGEDDDPSPRSAMGAPRASTWCVFGCW